MTTEKTNQKQDEREYLTFVCMSQKLAGFLMLKGFKLHEIKPNEKNPYKNVFIFTNSENLQKAKEEYKTLKENGQLKF